MAKKAAEKAKEPRLPQVEIVLTVNLYEYLDLDQYWLLATGVLSFPNELGDWREMEGC